MSTVAESLVKTLARGRGQANLWNSRRFAQWDNRRDPPTENHRMGSRPPRGSGGVRRGRRCARHRRAGRLRRELRSRQPSSHQWAIRLPSKRRAGSCNCGPYSKRRDRFRLFPGDASRISVPGMQLLLSVGLDSCPDAACAGDRDDYRNRSPRSFCDRAVRRRCAPVGRASERYRCLSKTDAAL